MKWFITYLFSLYYLLVGATYATLITDGGFDSTITNFGNQLEVADLDAGWGAKGSWTLVGGKATSGSASNGSRPLVQSNILGSETGSLLKLSFEWSPDALASGANLTVNYSVMGWYTTGTPLDTDDLWNPNTKQTALNDSPASANGAFTAVDLLSGTTYSTGDIDPSEIGVTSSAGTTNFFSSTLNISGFDDAHDDLSEFDYIGIGFYIASSSVVSGSTIDNVSLTVIPEASSLAFLFFGVGFVAQFRHRRYANCPDHPRQDATDSF